LSYFLHAGMEKGPLRKMWWQSCCSGMIQSTNRDQGGSLFYFSYNFNVNC